MRVLGLNGILTHGEGSTDRLLKRVKAKGYDTVDVNYPVTTAILAHFFQTSNARYLVDAHQPGDCLIAHSYGCLLAYRAMLMGAQFDKVFMFAPAMGHKVHFPMMGFNEMYVMFHREDMAIKIGSLLPFHAFGKMGRVGYKGPQDARIHNIETTGDSAFDRFKHSHYFSSARIGKWADFVDHSLQSVVAGA